MARNLAPPARADAYSRITAEIVAAIEAGVRAWKMPWHHDGSAITRPTNVSGRRYRGVNVIVLWVAAQAAGYGTGLWGTCMALPKLGSWRGQQWVTGCREDGLPATDGLPSAAHEKARRRLGNTVYPY